MATETEPLSDARQTLLRALEALDRAEEEFGEPKDTYLVVCYAHHVEGRTLRGWAGTDHPTFATAGLLREIAEVIECTPMLDADEDDGDDDSAAAD